MIEEIARFRLEDVPDHAAGAARDVRPAHARAGAAPPRRGRARRPRLRRDVHAEPAPRRRHDVEAARADLGRADRAADDAAPEPRRGGARGTSTRARARSRCSRSRASTSPAATCRTSALRVAGIAEGGFLRVKGVVETLYAALKAEPTFERARAPAAPSGQDRAHAAPGSSASCTRACSRATWGAFELDLDELFARVARAGHLRGRDHVPGRAAGHRRRRRRGRAGRRPRRGRARGRRAASCARSASSTSTAASRSARAASRSRSRSPTSRPRARSPRRTLRDRRRALAERSAQCLRRAPFGPHELTGADRRFGTLRERAQSDLPTTGPCVPTGCVSESDPQHLDRAGDLVVVAALEAAADHLRRRAVAEAGGRSGSAGAAVFPIAARVDRRRGAAPRARGSRRSRARSRRAGRSSRPAASRAPRPTTRAAGRSGPPARGSGGCLVDRDELELGRAGARASSRSSARRSRLGARAAARARDATAETRACVAVRTGCSGPSSVDRAVGVRRVLEREADLRSPQPRGQTRPRGPASPSRAPSAQNVHSDLGGEGREEARAVRGAAAGASCARCC